jgi:dihydroxyacetone synthase
LGIRVPRREFAISRNLELGSLTVVYDNEQITCEGSVDLTNTEDVNAKMRACGWEVLDVEDGSFDGVGGSRGLEGQA